MKPVQDFRSDSSFYCYSPVSYGQRLTTLIRQYQRMTGKFKCWRLNNHPPALLKNIPENINKRLTSISSNKEVFDEAIPPYQKALDESGYTYKLTYNPQPTQTPTRNRKRNRQRNITWYNPPWNSNVKTNLGRKFLNIVDKCFPKNHPLHKIFNRHTFKLSYSCMPNMKSIIASHNKTLLTAQITPQPQHNNLTSSVTAEEKTNALLTENASKRT